MISWLLSLYLLATPRVEKNIHYCNGGKVALTLDLYAPESRVARGAIVLIHGGGGRVGDKSNRKQVLLGTRLAELGFVAVSINYRLSITPDEESEPKKPIDDPFQVGAPFSAYLEDAKCAVRWIRSQRLRFGFAAEHVGVMGSSHGAQTALLVGLTDDESFRGTGDLNSAAARFSSKPTSIVNWFGPTDLVELYNTFPPYEGNARERWDQQGGHPLVQQCRGTPSEAPDCYKQSSAIGYLDSADPPILTLQGGIDTIVPKQQALLLDTAAKANRVSHSLQIYPLCGHDFQSPLASIENFVFEDAIRRTLHFFSARYPAIPR